MPSMEKDFNFYFRQDLLQLFNCFYQEKSFRYADFVKTWNRLKFFQIFSIQRFFPIEYRLFVKDIFKITVEYFYDEDLYTEVRTAALYTLFGLYANQTNRPRLKIPVTPKQWIQILKFIEEISQAEHVDVEYSFRYLVHSDAFEFCSNYEVSNTKESAGLKATSQIKAVKNMSNADENLTTKVMDQTEFNEVVFNDDINEQIGTIHEAYLQCKDDVNCANPSNKKLSNYINNDFKTVIGEDILKWLEKAPKSEKDYTVFDKLSGKRSVKEDESDDQESSDEEKPKTSKEAAKNSTKKSRKPLKSKFNRNFQGMFLDAEQSDDETNNE